jgi:hypothetical protein
VNRRASIDSESSFYENGTTLNLLTAAIPGLREIRAPLVAGYLWILAAWLLIDPSLPLRESTDDPVRSLVELADLLGPVGTAAAISVAAYLVGASWLSLTALFRRREELFAGGSVDSYAWYLRDDDAGRQVRRLEDKGAGRDQRWEPVTSKTLAEAAQGDATIDSSVYAWVLDPLPGPMIPSTTTEQLQRLWPCLNTKRKQELIDRVNGMVWRWAEEFHLDPTLLITGADRAFSEVSRRKAEAEFRIGAVGPLTAVFALLAIQDHSAWWLLGLVVCAFLFAEGMNLLTETQRLIWNAMSQGQAPSPAVQEYVGYVERRVREVLG